MAPRIVQYELVEMRQLSEVLHQRMNKLDSRILAYLIHICRINHVIPCKEVDSSISIVESTIESTGPLDSFAQLYLKMVKIAQERML